MLLLSFPLHQCWKIPRRKFHRQKISSATTKGLLRLTWQWSRPVMLLVNHSRRYKQAVITGASCSLCQCDRWGQSDWTPGTALCVASAVSEDSKTIVELYTQVSYYGSKMPAQKKRTFRWNVGLLSSYDKTVGLGFPACGRTIGRQVVRPDSMVSIQSVAYQWFPFTAPSTDSTLKPQRPHWIHCAACAWACVLCPVCTTKFIAHNWKVCPLNSSTGEHEAQRYRNNSHHYPPINSLVIYLK